MRTSLVLDPSRPYQTSEDLLALWLPRGRGRDALASGLVMAVDLCENPSCPCTEAQLHALPIDDRAEKARYDDGHLLVTWRSQPGEKPRPEGPAHLTLDIMTGVVQAKDGAELPAMVAPFFVEPLPYWVLDALWARWRAPRLSTEHIDWQAQALEHWEPGVLLSTMLAFPEERFDCYVLDGKQYQVDTLFSVEPDRPCTEAVLSVLEWSEDRKRAEERGDARLPLETMMPRGFEGRGLSSEAFVHLYLEWRRRNVPAEERIVELRDMTRQRGLELHQLVERRRARNASRNPPPSPPAASLAGVGRNEPCPCGSGKKYKRCCGA
jgi:hypothetical protein